MEENNNYNTNKGSKKIAMVVILVVVGIIAGAVYFLMGGQEEESSYFDDGIANPTDRFISFFDRDLQEGEYSYHNKGYIKDFDLSLEAGTYNCSFFVYDDYPKSAIGLEETVLDVEGDIRFIVLNQEESGTTTGNYNGGAALYVNNIDNAYTYIKNHLVKSKGKNDPIKVVTNLEDYTGFYVACYNPYR